jgi:hypothetical protein
MKFKKALPEFSRSVIENAAEMWPFRPYMIDGKY